MTLTTEVYRFPEIELPLPGAQADDRVKWMISDSRAGHGAEDPFRTQVPRLFGRSGVERSDESLATPNQISNNWTRLSRSGITTEAYSRLFKIATRTEGWRGPGSRALHSASLAGFLNFWSLICEQAVEPEFTLLPNGHLGAEWYKNSHRHLDMEFVDDQLAYFGFFNGATEIEGKANIPVIAQLLTTDAAHPLRWKSR